MDSTARITAIAEAFEYGDSEFLIFIAYPLSTKCPSVASPGPQHPSNRPYFTTDIIITLLYTYAHTAHSKVM